MKIIFSNVKYKNTQPKSWTELAALSNHRFKQLGFETIFFGDEWSLKEYKNIEYDHFELIPQNEINQFPECLWSMGKLIALNKIKEPCIHIDQDIILNKNFNIDYFNRDILCLHDENFAMENMEILQALFESRTPVMKIGCPTVSYNCGFIGGNDYKSLQDGLNIIFNYVIDNYEFIEFIYNKYKNFRTIAYLFYPAVLVEQIWLFQILICKLNKPISTVFSGAENWKHLRQIMVKKGIVHLMKAKSLPTYKNIINKAVKDFNIKY